jgi:uncharacterized membrane protein YozB (DUF420 family)
MSVSDLPALNASLNAISAALLLTGYVFIRRKQWQRHRACMIAALAVSALFLASYLVYHFNVGSVPFQGRGAVRAVYFTILITHIILAAAIVPLALVTVSRGLSRRYDRHRAIARVTLPVWLYVSVTGVVIYVMLYRM